MATETWLLNETLQYDSLDYGISSSWGGDSTGFYIEVEFLCDGIKYYGFTAYNSHFPPEISRDIISVYYNSWDDQKYRTITFAAAPTGDLLTWLQANGTKQVTSKVSVDLTTLPGWASLSDGSHSITIVAKADGYRDSEPSAAVSVTKAAPVYTDCITFTGESSDFTLAVGSGGAKEWNGTVQYSTDHNTWTTWNGTAVSSVNKKLYLRGSGNTTFRTSKGARLSLSARAACSGNIQTLLEYSNPPTSIPANSCYQRMFNNCTNLTAAPALSATTLMTDCYNFMFYGCTSLINAPELPATTLTEACYSYMFSNCTSLTSAPKLPVTTLAKECYRQMFGGCTSLTTAPELPATTLKEYCYQLMFYNCINLTSAPKLSITTLARSCCQSMFDGCTKLKVNTTSGNKIFTCPSITTEWDVDGMFKNTGGAFTGTPTAGTTYYWTE